MARCRTALLFWLVLGGCDSAADAAPRCALSPAHVVADAPSARFDGLSLDVRGEQRLAVWSGGAGLFARRLAGSGAPAGPSVRVGERCLGGVDVELTAAGALLGCVRRNSDQEASEVVLYELDQALSVTEARSLGRAGRDGQGIAIETEGARTYVLFSEGLVGAHTMRRVILERDLVEDRVVSRPGRAASEPALLATNGGVHTLFTENDYDSPARPVTSIVAVDAAGDARVLRKVSVPDPAPKLVRDARGLVLTYRDRVGAERRSELYALRVHGDLSPEGTPVKVGRANTEGAPGLYVCGAWRMGLLPREYADERYIAVHALGERLQNLSGGHQFYANSREFVLAQGACAGDELLFLAGERDTPADRSVQLVAMRFSCSAHAD